MLERVVRTALGEDKVRAAVRAAQKVIVDGLSGLNRNIPVVSRARDVVPYAQRKGWNHLWLVDPLDGEAAFAAGNGKFSVNIALIEDGSPIYGVVHVPASSTTYYATPGKGAFRRTNGSEPVRLAASSQPVALPSVAANERGGGAATEHAADTSSHALSMCALVEDTQRHESLFGSSMEWHTAAADAILRSAGMHVRQFESATVLGYNKKDFVNGAVKVVPFQARPPEP